MEGVVEAMEEEGAEEGVDQGREERDVRERRELRDILNQIITKEGRKEGVRIVRALQVFIEYYIEHPL